MNVIKYNVNSGDVCQIGRQYEYGKTQVIFEGYQVIDSANEIYFKFVGRTEDSKYLIPIVDMTLDITQQLTKHVGQFSCQLEEMNTEGTLVSQSPVFYVAVKRSIKVGADYEVQDPRLETIYQKYNQMYNTISQTNETSLANESQRQAEWLTLKQEVSDAINSFDADIAISEYRTLVQTETDNFNTNAETKLTAYNQNDSQKTTAYNTNATEKLNTYNTNAENKVSEFNAQTEQIQTDISELKSDLVYTTLKLKFIKNAYVNTDGIVNNETFKLYKLDGISSDNIVLFDVLTNWSTNSYKPYERVYIEKTDGSFISLIKSSYVYFNPSISQFIMMINNDIKNIYYYDYVNYESEISIYLLNNNKNVVSFKNGELINNSFIEKPYDPFDYKCLTHFYYKSSKVLGHNKSKIYFWLFLKSGEKLKLTNVMQETAGFSFEVIKISDNLLTADSIEVHSLGEKTYTATEDCFVIVNVDDGSTNEGVLLPKQYLEIINTNDNSYKGMNGVAFGTSLTYRAQTTGGYLQYLPTMSGITFDNQGVGSSKIYGNAESSILNKILNYTDYADKNIVLIEGFVNDWYNNSPLGDIYDTGTDTVCGCLYNAIHHILTTNNNITIVVILDHFGINANDVDMSASVSKNVGKQLDYYETLAKVCMLYGVHCIKEYKNSNMNQDTQKYYLDYIHMNALGAEQSANAIWSELKNIVPSI